MALETLKGVKEIGGFKVFHANSQEELKTPAAASCHVAIQHEHNAMFLKLQQGPIKEVGVNGCQVDTLIHAAKAIIEGLNEKFPCRENALVITKLDEAIHWLDHRTKDRENRGVEGTNQA